MSKQQRCRHCKRPKVNRPRGLCWTCYYTPGVRESIPVVSKFATNAAKGITVDLGMRIGPLPTQPTSARPGSEAKIEILEKRAERGEQLFHPLDVSLVARPVRKKGTAA